MRILIIGATGYVGSAASAALRRRGHEVIGTARTPEAAVALESRGDLAVAGDVQHPRALADIAGSADGVIYAVQLSGAGPDAAFATERDALSAILEALADSDTPFVYTSGVWYYGATNGAVADEDTPPNPPALVARRPELERLVLAGADRGVRTIVLRPGVVYGLGRGLPALFSKSARKDGAARYIGDGAYVWPVVHVDDLGGLFALAIEEGEPRHVFNASDGSAFRVRDMAEAASRGAGQGGRTVSWPIDEARRTLGPLVDALVLDQRISSDRARTLLGWRTRASTILDDLERGSYADA